MCSLFILYIKYSIVRTYVSYNTINSSVGLTIFAEPVNEFTCHYLQHQLVFNNIHFKKLGKYGTEYIRGKGIKYAITLFRCSINNIVPFFYFIKHLWYCRWRALKVSVPSNYKIACCVLHAGPHGNMLAIIGAERYTFYIWVLFAFCFN